MEIDYQIFKNKPAFFVVFITIILTGCGGATSTIWKEKHWESHSYNEVIHQFLVTEDNKQLVILGDKFHYIFNEAEPLNNIILSNNRTLLSADLDSRFFVLENNSFNISFNIKCDCTNATKAQIDWLNENNFEKERSNSSGFIYSRRFILNGKKYLSNGIPPSRVNTLNKKYNIAITEYYESSDILLKTAFTPISVAADGAAVIAVGSVLIVTSPLFIIDMLVKDTESSSGVWQ